MVPLLGRAAQAAGAAASRLLLVAVHRTPALRDAAVQLLIKIGPIDRARIRKSIRRPAGDHR